ncbi:MAG: hypothetical protein M3280_07280 [Actinomycetota bacterium]|nr:hypothetical protein [Actinomycetota bacterium]
MRRPRDERGQSIIETVLLGLLFLVPVVWLLGVLAETHRAVLAATAATREAGFEAARSEDPARKSNSIHRTVATAFLNHGLDPHDAEVRYSTTGVEGDESVEIRVSYRLPVLRAPLLGETSDPAIRIEATHVSRVDPYRSHP